MNRGYLIVAQNTETVDYLQCARVLARSIRYHMPTASVSLLTDDTTVDDSLYDNIIPFPHGDRCVGSEWKLANDWQVYDASPYTHTIKIEADVYLPRSIEHWWDVLLEREMNIVTNIRNYRGELSDVRTYRPTIDRNRLPDTYNAITYFRRGGFASEFYAVVRSIFENWDTWRTHIVTMKDEPATTDIVYALAARILGEQHCTNPQWQHISLTHMKRHINGGILEDWTHEYVYEIHPHTVRINTYPQSYPLHYHVKSFAATLDTILEEPSHG